MRVVILNVQQRLYEGVVSHVILPAAQGELSLMDDHEPLFAALTKGFIRMQAATQVITASGESTQVVKPIFIHRGLARMKGNELMVLVE